MGKMVVLIGCCCVLGVLVVNVDDVMIVVLECFGYELGFVF